MTGNGICSTDVVIQELRDKISNAETEISRIIANLPHCEVSGMLVTYNRSTSRYPEDALFTDGRSTGIHVDLQYRIY